MRDTDARLRKGIGNALLALAMVALSAAPAAAQQDIGNLMRQKLDRAQGLFEAVVLARFPGRRPLRGRSAAHQRTVHLDADDGAGVSSPRWGVSGSRAKPRSGGRGPRHRRGLDRLHDPDVELRAMPPVAARIRPGGAQAGSAPPGVRLLRSSSVSYVRPMTDRWGAAPARTGRHAAPAVRQR